MPTSYFKIIITGTNVTWTACPISAPISAQHQISNKKASPPFAGDGPKDNLSRGLWLKSSRSYLRHVSLRSPAVSNTKQLGQFLRQYASVLLRAWYMCSAALLCKGRFWIWLLGLFFIVLFFSPHTMVTASSLPPHVPFLLQVSGQMYKSFTKACEGGIGHNHITPTFLCSQAPQHSALLSLYTALTLHQPEPCNIVTLTYILFCFFLLIMLPLPFISHAQVISFRIG